MAKNVKPMEVSEKEVEEKVNDDFASDEVDANVDYRNIIKHLIASGCKRIESNKIKNVNFTEKDNYTMISFTLIKPIRGFVSEDGGITYKEGLTNVVFTSSYAIAGAFKEDEELGWMANSILENPKALNLILNGATIDIIQQEFAAGEEIVNPFSSKESVSGPYDHDVIINHIVGYKLSKVGQRMSDRLADKCLGF